MMMQWFVNEVREKFEQMNQRIEGLAQMVKGEAPATQIDSGKWNERLAKLEGEVRMIKARAAKNKNNKEPDIDK